MFLSICSCVLLFAAPNRSCLLFIVPLVALFFCLNKERMHELRQARVTRIHVALAMLLNMVGAVLFYLDAAGISVASRVCGSADMLSPQALVGMVAILCALGGVYFMSRFLAFVAAEGAAIYSSSGVWGGHDAWRRGCQFGLRLLIGAGFLALLLSSFSYNMWLDPIYSMLIIELPFTQFMQALVSDVHPPLYYFILKLVEDALSVFSTDLLFKFSVGKLVSVSAYVATAGLLWKKLGGSHHPCLREMAVLCLFLTTPLLNFGVEVRMYSWALFFLVGSLLYARDIMLGHQGVPTWSLLVLYSLGSAYTHNFTLISAAVLWLCLLVWIVLYDKAALKRWFISGLVVAIGYLPWLIILLLQTSRIAGHYWIPEYGLREVFYFFYSLVPAALLLVFVVTGYFARWRMKNDACVRVELPGIFLPFAVLILTLGISFLYFPIVSARYLLPASCCMWLSVVLLWSRMRGMLSAAVALILVGTVISACGQYVAGEYEAGREARQLVELISDIDENALIYTEGDYRLNGIPLGYLANRSVYVRAKEPRSAFISLLRTNRVYTDDSAQEFALRALADGKSVVLFVAEPLATMMPEGTECTYLGYVKIFTPLHVYRLARCM